MSNKKPSAKERERLSDLTTRAMVNGLDSLTEAERKERDELAIRLLYTKDSKGRLFSRKSGE